MFLNGKEEKLKACLFDFGGTLDADGIAWQDRFYPLYQKHGLLIDREEFRQAFYGSDDTLVETGRLKGKSLQETVEAQVQGVWARLHIQAPKTQFRAIVDDFLEDMHKHARRNRRLLQQLSKRYALGIVSNFYGNLAKVCDDLGIGTFFACLIDSSHVGAKKPDPRIFHTALASLGVQPDQAFFVGDNLYRDMEGAKAVGMPHIWLAGEQTKGGSPCCPEDPIIRTLEELGPLLANRSRGKRDHPSQEDA
jgi:putative hydrolase of the HAD superfamily